MYLVFDIAVEFPSNGFDSWRGTYIKFDEALLAVATEAHGETAQIVEMDRESMTPRAQYVFRRCGEIYVLSSRWNYVRETARWVAVVNGQEYGRVSTEV